MQPHQYSQSFLDYFEDALKSLEERGLVEETPDQKYRLTDFAKTTIAKELVSELKRPIVEEQTQPLLGAIVITALHDRRLPRNISEGLSFEEIRSSTTVLDCLLGGCNAPYEMAVSYDRSSAEHITDSWYQSLQILPL